MVIERLKTAAEKLTGIARPSSSALTQAVRDRKASTYRFKASGIIPNHPRWPLVLYRGAVRFEDGCDSAAVLEDLFARNGWGGSWRNGIYDYAHYHSRIHEVLGIARGNGTVRFGGDHGRVLTLKAGDVAILPAGTGHQALSHSDDFLVVGAYPPTGTYDECASVDELKGALKTIPKVARPCKDPVYGAIGPLLKTWRPLAKRKTKPPREN